MENYILEIRDTIDTANRALMNLRKAKEALDVGWWASLADLFSNSFLVSCSKYHKLSYADKELENAQKAVNSLNNKLKHLAKYNGVRVDNSKLANMLDLWMNFDVLDGLTHIKIGNAKKNVNNAIKQVEALRKSLREELEYVGKGN